ncbi:MAG: DUF47 family protein [bacterium]|nr:DUF47 family protein [bacterium]
MLGRFLPKEMGFFDFFEKIAALTIEACNELLSLATDSQNIAGRVARIKELEHQADDVTHECIEALHKTFITPIDRTDIHSLIKRMDDIIDSVDAATSRIVLYEITQMRSESRSLAEVLVKASREIEQAVHNLRNMKHPEKVKENCIAIYQLENEGDAILRSALVRLFKEEKDAVLVIKWKEIYERLEKATDRCEQVANIISGVVIEAS